MRILQAIGAHMPADPARWIAALATAETTAAAAQGAKVYFYQVNYRVAAKASQTRGVENDRRDGLVDLIRSVKPEEEHLSTSMWRLKLHIKLAETVGELLFKPLDGDLDSLHVIQVSNTNYAAFGVSTLKS